ncbi:MAG: hypothetical protein LBG74_01855 [Spirochaetaceae bacterium]|jgi:hypothetical protein|nr:hypothetical protein [Spirochaetaceae bacterium]
MDIKIDGKDADITLDGEKTLGDVLSGISRYLESAGFCAAGLEVDGMPVTDADVERVFAQNVDTLQTLNVKTRTDAEMAADALITIENTVKAGELPAGFETSAPFMFLKEKEGALYTLITSMAAKQDYERLGAELREIVEERRRELASPAKELQAMKESVHDVCRRLNDFPLDIQTGKDAQAAAAVEYFTLVIRKLFRLVLLAQFYGYSYTGILNSDSMNEFNSVLKEFLSAYENGDTVLSGDLAEYELSVRFMDLYNQFAEIKHG